MDHDSDTAGPDGFRRLWPTIIVERSLPGHEAANTALLQVIEELEAANRDLTTDYLGGNFLALENPAAQWLRDCVNKTVVDYFKHLGMDYALNWSLQGWANINRLGDYHDLHNHPHAYLSGTYYVKLPDGPPKIGARRDLRPGCITFYDPRGAVNMTAVKRDPYIEAEFTLRPKAGTILMWPAFLHHFVHPNLSDEPRVSVSFNVVLKWSDDYLPAQP
ncbi:MAG: 2OG-Fe(II) oxygenase family protein [Rhodospirillales bacterium]|nr:2OG-Fe(II) oxygenase family protein [Rhodospirillales bacterium]